MERVPQCQVQTTAQPIFPGQLPSLQALVPLAKCICKSQDAFEDVGKATRWKGYAKAFGRVSRLHAGVLVLVRASLADSNVGTRQPVKGVEH